MKGEMKHHFDGLRYTEGHRQCLKWVIVSEPWYYNARLNNRGQRNTDIHRVWFDLVGDVFGTICMKMVYSS